MDRTPLRLCLAAFVLALAAFAGVAPARPALAVTCPPGAGEVSENLANSGTGFFGSESVYTEFAVTATYLSGRDCVLFAGTAEGSGSYSIHDQIAGGWTDLWVSSKATSGAAGGTYGSASATCVNGDTPEYLWSQPALSAVLLTIRCNGLTDITLSYEDVTVEQGTGAFTAVWAQSQHIFYYGTFCSYGVPAGCTQRSASVADSELIP